MRITKTFYKIKRDYDDSTCFFIVNVPEANDYGIGFQLNWRDTLYGLSIHTS